MIALTKASNKYQLNFHGKKVLLNFCELLAFRNAIKKIDIDTHFFNNHSGLEIITLCNFREILILETLDVLEFKKIFEGVFSTKQVKVLL